MAHFNLIQKGVEVDSGVPKVPNVPHSLLPLQIYLLVLDTFLVLLR